MRRVCGKFPYRSNDPHQATLLGDASVISMQMKDLLQARVEIIGLDIHKMDLAELSYTKDVAQDLL